MPPAGAKMPDHHVYFVHPKGFTAADDGAGVVTTVDRLHHRNHRAESPLKGILDARASFRCHSHETPPWHFLVRAGSVGILSRLFALALSPSTLRESSWDRGAPCLSPPLKLTRSKVLTAVRDWLVALAVAAVVFMVVAVGQQAWDSGTHDLEGPAPAFVRNAR